MQFRVVRNTYKGKVRQYGQIVESYRRESDGMPTHRLIASLGILTDEQAANFKAAFAASRLGQQVRVVDAETLAAAVPAVAWTRDLAGICAVLQAFSDCGLQELVHELFAGHGEDCDPAAVVAALVTQRCVAPDSKLAACRWFGDTVLPDLLSITPAQFHNSRVHRVLDRLQAKESDLQAALASRLLRADGLACHAYFIDCTDTWFVGHGPAMARRGKTKEEFYRAKIGIVLLCRQDGMPLRFEVVQGNTDDGVAMLTLLRTMATEPWLGGAPVVCDRALGNTSDFLEFIDMGLPFVTALVRSEHAAYGAVVDCPGLASIDPNDSDWMDKVGDAVVQAGMTRHGDDLYCLDRPSFRRGANDRLAAEQALGSRTRPPRTRGYDLARDMLTQARKYRGAVDAGEVPSMAALQRGIGRSNGHMHRYLSLLKLPTAVQEQILQGHAKHLSKHAILRICSGKDATQKAESFAVECAQAGNKKSANHQQPQPPNDAGNPWLHVVVVFNPKLWKAKRSRAEAKVAKTEALLARTNRQVADKSLSIRAAKIKLNNALQRSKLSRFYAEPVQETEKNLPVLRLVRDELKWQQARSRDGFHVVVGSPEIDKTGAELVKLYRSKDQVEKDFREIKSVLELRPVRHRADAKVRAHVALCVLALAVQRTIDHKLANAGRTESAAAALQELSNVRLVGLRFPGQSAVIASPSETTADRRALAKALGVDWALGAASLREHVRKIRL